MAALAKLRNSTGSQNTNGSFCEVTGFHIYIHAYKHEHVKENGLSCEEQGVLPHYVICAVYQEMLLVLAGFRCFAGRV